MKNLDIIPSFKRTNSLRNITKNPKDEIKNENQFLKLIVTTEITNLLDKPEKKLKIRFNEHL